MIKDTEFTGSWFLLKRKMKFSLDTGKKQRNFDLLANLLFVVQATGRNGQ